MESYLNQELILQFMDFLTETHNEQGINNQINGFFEEPYLEQESPTRAVVFSRIHSLSKDSCRIIDRLEDLQLDEGLIFNHSFIDES